jgi:diguanylate cyclase
MAETPVSTRSAAAITAVARETLRRIASERVSPTPEIYAKIYAQIAATHPDHPRSPPSGANGQDGKTGASIIGRLLTQLDVHHAGITITRKREGLKRALVPRLEPLDALYARLNRLMDSWNGPNADVGGNAGAFLGTDIMGSATEVESSSAERHNASESFSLSQLFDSTHAESPAPHARTQPVVAAMPSRPLGPPSDVTERMVSFRLAGLLAMLLKNIGDLTPESALVGSQIEQIGRVLTAPLTEKKLDEAERCVRALVVRQGAIKHSIDETKRAIRELAETLLERLSSLVSSTDNYATKVVDLAERIAETDDLGKLSDLTQILVADARLMSANIAAERALLAETQAKTRALSERTTLLEHELREASTLIRTDPLTRAMNRRGFNDAFKSELARSQGAPLSIVLIDVDNFKRINEEHGHSVGDEVLCQLVEVLQRSAQPANIVSRYGGEEFALMFPGMPPEAAEREVIKMQRALMDHQTTATPRVPAVTFSGGVARVEPNESLADVITRADRALRKAKLAGKNRVVVASGHEARATAN